MTILARLFKIAIILLLSSLVAAHLGFFTIRTMHLVAYPFPLDYGEGPLLAQVGLLRNGTSIWQLYRDPGLTPYAVVNYPPVYHIATWLVSLVTVPLIGTEPHGILLAGRIVSLIAGLLCVPALVLLAISHQPSAISRQPSADREPQESGVRSQESGVRSQESEDQEPRTENRELPRGHPNRELRTKNQRTQESGVRSQESGVRSQKTENQGPPNHLVTQSPSHLATIVLVTLALLGMPIMREWSSVMRVDLLGICFGLWGLLVAQRYVGTRQVLWAAPLFALALLTKPSLVAAPVAALIWLLFRDWRRAVLVGGLLGVLGGLAIGLLQLASGGWFWVHVISANTNPWDADLAHNFWRDQFVLMQPLVLAGVAAIASGLLFKTQKALLLPLYYTLFGLMAAFGVGKLGAYTNYFLEAYTGLFWLAAAGFGNLTRHQQPEQTATRPIVRQLAALLRPGILLLVAVSLTRYYPLWSEEYLLPAGIIEGRNPARVSFGGHGIWQDLQREQQILAARTRINQALADPLRAAQGPIFTDIPGVAAQFGIISREQVFEHRMLFDNGLWDQRPLLADMASGRVPLIVLDYLGNWLTPAQILVITHRYAQDLSIGTYSIYRPIDPGPRTDIALDFPNGLRATGVHLAQPTDGSTAYGPGETLAVTLEWQQTDIRAGKPISPTVLLQLADRAGRPLLSTTRPLLYGALASAEWGASVIQHMQPVSLPPELPPGTYRLTMTLLVDGQELMPPRDLSSITIAEGQGRILGEQGFYVPPPFLAEWERLGGYAGPGDPVMPAVPFAGFVQQCFKTTCLRLAQGRIERLPAGELTWMADAVLPRIDGAPAGQLSPEFQQLYDQLGGAATLGPPLGVEMKRFGDIVQYTRYARLERPLAGGPARLGNVGEDVLRLPGGTPYRWP